MVSKRWGDIYGRVDTTEATGRTSWRNDSVVVKDRFIENHLRVVKRNSPYVEYKGYCCRQKYKATSLYNKQPARKVCKHDWCN
jgi:hypothetical protein